MEDRKKVTEVLMGKPLAETKSSPRLFPIDCFYASSYRRSYDTVAHCASLMGKAITRDERLRERLAGPGGHEPGMLERRWADFTSCEEGGESLQSVQRRNIEALNEILKAHEGENIVIGTHGTALSTILHFYDDGFGREGFIRIYRWMPYVVRLDFQGLEMVGKEELLIADRGYENRSL